MSRERSETAPPGHRRRPNRARADRARTSRGHASAIEPKRARRQRARWPLRRQRCAALVVCWASSGSRSRRDAHAPGDRRVSRFTVDLPKDQVIVPRLQSGSGALAGRDAPRLHAFARSRIHSAAWMPSTTSRSTSPSRPGFRGGPVFSPDGAFISFIEGNSNLLVGTTVPEGRALRRSGRQAGRLRHVSPGRLGSRRVDLLDRQLSRRDRPHPRLRGTDRAGDRARRQERRAEPSLRRPAAGRATRSSTRWHSMGSTATTTRASICGI